MSHVAGDVSPVPRGPEACSVCVFLYVSGALGVSDVGVCGSSGPSPDCRVRGHISQCLVASHPCRVSNANGCLGGFCVSEKDCGDGSDEKTCPEPAGQCIEAHAPSP